MKININKFAMVRPASHTPNHVIPSSNIDLVIPMIHTPSVYFYTTNNIRNGGHHGAFSFEHLKDSLSRALVSFYPIAGQLIKSTKSGRLDIDCNAEGVLLVEAEAEGSMSYYGEEFAPSLKMRRLIPELDYSQPISSHPILILQVTFFQCGGVSVGVGFQHTVADGPSALQFLNFWGDMARWRNNYTVTAEPKINPVFDRSILKARDPPTPKFKHLEYHNPPQLLQAQKTALSHHSQELELFAKMREDHRTDQKLSDFETDLFFFSKEQVLALKTQAVAAAAKSDQMFADDDQYSKPKAHFTTYEVLSAHIWRCVCLARGLQDSQLSKLYISTDGRKRLRPELPDGYFGNVIFTTTATKSVGDLAAAPLGEIAEFIRSELQRRDDEYLRSAIDYLQLREAELSSLTRGAHTFRSPNLGLVSWTRLPIYGLDFGCGPPISMGPAGIPFEGQGFISPARANDTRLRLSITLLPVHMIRFRELLHCGL